MIRKISKILRRLRPLNRRKHPRFEFRQSLPCICVCAKSGQQIEFPSWLLNVSKAGFLISTGENKVYPGTVLTIRFQLPVSPENFSVTGKILRVYRRRSEYYYYSAGRFINADEPGIKALLDFAHDSGV